MKETIKRILAETPGYFKNLQLLCLWFISAASAALTAISTLELTVPLLFISFLKYAIVAATFIGFTSQLTRNA